MRDHLTHQHTNCMVEGEYEGGIVCAMVDPLARCLGVHEQMRFSDGIKPCIHRPPAQFKGVEPFRTRNKINNGTYFLYTKCGDDVNGTVKCAEICSYQLKYGGLSVQGEYL